MELGWNELSDDEREREYSPSSCLPDGNYGPFVEEYRVRSDAALAKVDSRSDVERRSVSYGPSPSETIELFVPRRGVAPPPLLVFIHGGYWQELSSRESLFPAAACADRGWAFAAVGYPLAPAVTLDEIVAACRSAVTILRGDARDFGVDARRIVLAGSSAGAHLAAMVAIDDTIDVAATVLVSGIFELEPLVGTTVNEALGLDAADAIRNSPRRGPIDGFPPTLLAWGAIETQQFKAQSQAFAQRLEQAGSVTATLEIAERNHFDVILDLAEPNTPLGDAVASLVDATARND